MPLRLQSARPAAHPGNASRPARRRFWLLTATLAPSRIGNGATGRETDATSVLAAVRIWEHRDAARALRDSARSKTATGGRRHGDIGSPLPVTREGPDHLVTLLSCPCSRSWRSRSMVEPGEQHGHERRCECPRPRRRRGHPQGSSRRSRRRRTRSRSRGTLLCDHAAGLQADAGLEAVLRRPPAHRRRVGPAVMARVSCTSCSRPA